MLVGLCELFIYLPDSRSLKDKRSTIKSFKAALRKKYNISISEIGHKNSWKQSTIGVGYIGDNRQLIDQVIDKIVKDVDNHPEFQLVNFQITVT
jgi:uncharacterized protein